MNSVSFLLPRRLRLLSLALIVAIPAALSLSPAAVAHAIIIDSSPRQDSTVKPGPENATLTFNTRLEKAGCKLTLLSPDGSRRVLTLSYPSDNQLGADLGPLPAGAYRIDWIALSVDGHLTRGRVPFSVAP